MRSQSSGQDVLTKTKQPKASKTQQATTMSGPDDPQSASSSSHSLTTGIIVDPSLEHHIHGGHDVLGHGLEYEDDGQDQPYSSSQLMDMHFIPRNSFTYVDAHDDIEGDPHEDGDPELDGSPPALTADELLQNGLANGADEQEHADGEQDDASTEIHYRSLRLPPILQVEKPLVTTTATQAASATRRKNEAQFKCPVPGCGSTFTRRFNLRGHLRSHTEERPFVCEWPGCGKGFARSHDCKRHTALHTAKQGTHVCAGCHKTFSRTDALNRHLKSDVGASCRKTMSEALAHQPSSRQASAPLATDGEDPSASLSGDMATLDVAGGPQVLPFDS